MTDQEYNALLLYFRKMSNEDLLKEFVTKRLTQNSPNDEERNYYYLLKCEVEDRNILAVVDNKGRIKPDKEIKTTSVQKDDHDSQQFKHKTIKEGVDKLLSSLRLEDPSTTLDHAKRVYANLTGDTLSNVNRLYHYKPKK